MFRMRRRPVLIWIKMQSLLSKYEAMGIGSLHLGLNWQGPGEALFVLPVGQFAQIQ
jgi:hypothetical protein